MDAILDFELASAYFSGGGLRLTCLCNSSGPSSTERWSLKWPAETQKVFWLNSASDISSLEELWKAWWRLDDKFRYHERCAHMIAERYLVSSFETQCAVDEWLQVGAYAKALGKRIPDRSRWPWSGAYSGGEYSHLRCEGWPWTEEMPNESYARPEGELVLASNVLSRADFDPNHSGPYMRAVARCVRDKVRGRYNFVIPLSSKECEEVGRL